MNTELKEFLEWTKTVRRQFEIDMDETWLTKPPIERVAIENLLIAYDQMTERLRAPLPSGAIKSAEEILDEIANKYGKQNYDEYRYWLDGMEKERVIQAIHAYHNQFAGDGWISVKDRLPEKDEQFNVCYFYIKWHVFTSGWSPSLNRWDYQNVYITHWQPLPQAPQNTKES